MADEGLKVGPVKERGIAYQSPQTARQGATKPCTRAGIDAHDTPPAVDVGELDLVGGDQTWRIGLDIDELAPEHVAAEQHLTNAALEAFEAELLARQAHRTGRQLGDPIDGHEQLAAADRRPDPRH